MTASPPPADALREALQRLDLRCENYVGADHRPRYDGCPANNRQRDGEGTADRWCLPCEVRAALAATPAPGLDEDARGALCLALARQQPSVKPSEIEAQADDLIASLKFMRYGIARLAGQEGGE